MVQFNALRQATVLATIVAILLSTLLTPATVLAQAASTTHHTLAANDTGEGVAIAWSADNDGGWTSAAASALLPTQPYGGYNLPLQTYTLLLEADRAAEIVVEGIVAAPLTDALTPATRELPPALDWTPDPNIVVDETPQLPSSPIFVLRQGDLHGLPIVVVAVSPIYEEDGVAKVAEAVSALIPGATLLDLANVDAARKSRAAPLRAAPVNVPVNGDALRSAHKLIVAQSGIQEVTFAELGGVSQPETLRLTYKGTEVALEIASDRLRFYAPEPGDRWNTDDFYWLSSIPGARKRISLLPGANATTPGVAYTRGVWANNRIYDSIYGGPDNDHWFHSDMRTDPSMSPLNAPTATVSAPSVLPLITSAGTFSIGVTVWVRPPDSACLANTDSYRLNVKLGAEEKEIGWNPAPGCQLRQDWTLPMTMTSTSQNMVIKLMPRNYILGIKMDHVSWQRPVRLDFRQQGADFWTDAGAWSYSWSNLPGNAYSMLLPIILGASTSAVGAGAGASPPMSPRSAQDWQLYDVTDPLQPGIVPASAAGFAQAASAKPRHYVLAALKNLDKPTVVAQEATNLGDVQAADAIYIGPAQFADELEPLFALRRDQGYTPLFVDIAGINDVYGFGFVSADAIRNFLRHRTDWQNLNRKISAVLVGDGTYDPKGYQGLLNDNLVTPYMAEVDPFIREVPCEACFAQLDGDNPVTGDDAYNGGGAQTAFFSADIWLGRFPVRNEAELATVVGKLLTYETQGGLEDAWRKHHVFLADNYILDIDSSQYAKLDEAGDFATITDSIVDLLPPGTKPSRVYYDPAPSRIVRTNTLGGPVPAPGRPGYYLTDPRSPTDPWRNASPEASHNDTITKLSSGAGLVIYNGHSNHFQYARTYTGPEDRVNYLMNTNTAAFAIQNADKYFIMLAMTCYTSQFARPTNNGVLDEILFRRSGAGAVAVWGPAGLTVVHGHDKLQTGFMNRLWSSPMMSMPLGALAEAGYDELLKVAPINQDAAMTFLLTGDPLTRARVAVETFNYLPVINW